VLDKVGAVTVDDHSRRALSFGAIAEHYNRFRPGPPAAALDWILPSRCEGAVDIGAGTGALTRLLVHDARDVVAVEPDPRMAAVLATGVPLTTVVSARAEELPLGGGRFDAVVGSSMWHWVDAERASLEVARVLRPGGVLGLLWSGPDRSQPWLDELLSGVRASAAPSDESPYRHSRIMGLAPEAPFSVPESHLVRWTLTTTPEDLVELACTYSRFVVLPEDEQTRMRDRLVDSVHHHPALRGRSEIELPMRCICWRAVRTA
jgi:SAM-dependent methyltransferase